MNIPHLSELPLLAAHRGHASQYPENSLEGIRSALEAGADFVEFDVFLSSDYVPVVIHDNPLQRTAGRLGEVMEMTFAELQKVEVNEFSRFGDRFSGIMLPSLENVVCLLTEFPQTRAFVELKRKSLKQFGISTMLHRILPLLEEIRDRCVLISFHAEAIAEVASCGGWKIGWVFEGWEESFEKTARDISPDYILIDYGTLPPGQKLWSGPWQWAFWSYDDPDAETALRMKARGADIVETMQITEVLASPLFREKRNAEL